MAFAALDPFVTSTSVCIADHEEGREFGDYFWELAPYRTYPDVIDDFTNDTPWSREQSCCNWQPPASTVHEDCNASVPLGEVSCPNVRQQHPMPGQPSTAQQDQDSEEADNILFARARYGSETIDDYMLGGKMLSDVSDLSVATSAPDVFGTTCHSTDTQQIPVNETDDPQSVAIASVKDFSSLFTSYCQVNQGLKMLLNTAEEDFSVGDRSELAARVEASWNKTASWQVADKRDRALDVSTGYSTASRLAIAIQKEDLLTAANIMSLRFDKDAEFHEAPVVLGGLLDHLKGLKSSDPGQSHRSAYKIQRQLFNMIGKQRLKSFPTFGQSQVMAARVPVFPALRAYGVDSTKSDDAGLAVSCSSEAKTGRKRKGCTLPPKAEKSARRSELVGGRTQDQFVPDRSCGAASRTNTSAASGNAGDGSALSVQQKGQDFLTRVASSLQLLGELGSLRLDNNGRHPENEMSYASRVIEAWLAQHPPAGNEKDDLPSDWENPQSTASRLRTAMVNNGGSIEEVKSIMEERSGRLPSRMTGNKKYSREIFKLNLEGLMDADRKEAKTSRAKLLTQLRETYSCQKYSPIGLASLMRDRDELRGSVELFFR